MRWKNNVWRSAGLTAYALSACVAQESEQAARPEIEAITQALDSTEPALSMYHWDAPNGPFDAYDTSWAADTYPYPANCDASCRLTRQTNAWNDMSQGLYAMRDMANAHGKLLSIPEWGVWTRDDGHGGGENPFYIGRMYDFIHAPETAWDIRSTST